jgi:curved DNA-binding protein CbpA
MIVYHMLKLKDWNVGHDAIKLAYRRVAFVNHPDMVTPREKELATLAMQQVNAARDLLLDTRRRRKYHRDGIVPWVV